MWNLNKAITVKISVVIQTYNCDLYLERVLQSVKAFDEIVICDMFSTDRTLEIARRYGCRIVYHEKTNYCEPARNFAIQSAFNEWVLLVDSDELVPDGLREYLYREIQRQESWAGLWIPRKNYLFGRFMHGDYPDYILRFFRKERIFWPPYVHAVPVIEGKVKKIPRQRKDLAFIHLINNPLELKLRKMNTYTDMEIEKRAHQYFSLWKMFYAPFFRFFKSYVMKGGFRDGKAGLVNAGLDAFYKFLTIAKIWESKVRPEDVDEELKK